jgi:hypothetical protein
MAPRLRRGCRRATSRSNTFRHNACTVSGLGALLIRFANVAQRRPGATTSRIAPRLRRGYPRAASRSDTCFG